MWAESGGDASLSSELVIEEEGRQIRSTNRQAEKWDAYQPFRCFSSSLLLSVQAQGNQRFAEGLGPFELPFPTGGTLGHAALCGTRRGWSHLQ